MVGQQYGELSCVLEEILELVAKKNSKYTSLFTKRGLAFIARSRDNTGNYLRTMPGVPPIYIGKLHYGGRVYDNFVPMLTTIEIWDRVQNLRQKLL